MFIILYFLKKMFTIYYCANVMKNIRNPLLIRNVFVCLDPPELTIRPQNLQVRVNGIAAFYCAARGDPIPNIQWRKNGKRVSSKYSLITRFI